MRKPFDISRPCTREAAGLHAAVTGALSDGISLRASTS